MVASMTCPSPVRSRACSAATTENAANIPAIMSASGTPTIVGAPSSWPVRLMIPPIPCTMRSYAVHARPGRTDPVGREAEALERPRAEVLDDDVGALDQALQRLLPVGMLEVERHAALVPIDGEVVGRDAV